MISADPRHVAKVQDYWQSLSHTSPRYYAFAEVLEAYYRLEKLERKLDHLFGDGAAERLLTK